MMIIILFAIMIHFAAPAWTLKGKRCGIDELNDGHKDDSPGPIYNMSEMGTKSSISGFKTGKSQRSEINHGVLNNPSPSQYNPNNPNLLTHSVTIPKEAKIDYHKHARANPGPGTYKANENFVKTMYPQFSVGAKYPSFVDITGNNPGPADYNNPEMSATMHRNSKFGSQTRFYQPNILHPGPADYTISKGFITGKNTVSKSKRSLEIKISPGPGDYKNSEQFEENRMRNKGKTLSKKLSGCFNTNSNTVDAFNNYLKDQPTNSGKSFSIGKQKRDVFPNNNLPGPTDYKISLAEITKDGVSVGFTMSSWNEHNDLINNPGPGHYEDQQAKTTRYTIPKSKSVDYLNSNPGAGRYESLAGMGERKYKYANQTVGNLIGKSKRTDFVSKNIAGVGDYNILLAKKAGVSIPKANRFGKMNDNPGPGDYNMTSTICNFAMYRKRF